MPHRIRFLDLEFDPESGEIFRLSGSRSKAPTRLSPQPARLLEFLIERRPDVVGLEEIREVLWPDVQIEFEQSLHFCIRQIRAALEDSASEPHYIETVPRRGYRFIAEVESGDSKLGVSTEDLVSPSPQGPIDADSRSRTPRTPLRFPRLVWVSLFAVLALVLILVPFWPVGSGEDPSPAARESLRSAPLRLAIMSFETMDPDSGRVIENSVAELLLLALEEPGVLEAEIIGPTTTTAYERKPDGLSKLIADYNLDYVLNGRFIQRDGQQLVLGELIRATDGTHIWVEALDNFPDDSQILEKVRDGVLRRLAEEMEREGRD